MSDDVLLPDLETTNHMIALRDIRDLPVGSDFSALLAREEARERGPRPSVVRALRSRLEPPAPAPAASEPEPTPALAPSPLPAPPKAAGAPSSPASPELPEAPWETKYWRGFPLYVCRHCDRLKTFELGEAAEHAERHHPGK